MFFNPEIWKMVPPAVEKNLGAARSRCQPRLFRLRPPLRGAAGASHRPVDRLEPRLHSAHGTLHLRRMGEHGGETLRHASKNQNPNDVSDSDGITPA